jgi:hypothetical protein
VFAGPRWFRLDEKYFSEDAIQDLPFTSGQSLIVRDNFTTYNEFLGGQVGSMLRLKRNRLCLDLTTKLAVGNNFQTLQVSGQTIVRDDTVPTRDKVLANQGLYAQPTNIGRRTFDELTIIPEIGVNIGLYLTENMKFSVGYGFFHMNNVIRPGTSIDPRLNIQPLNAGAGAPFFPVPIHENTDFWAQWLSLGFEVYF